MATAISQATKRLLTGLFNDGDTAERAYQACIDLGYEIGEVNVVLSEARRKELLSEGSETKAKLAERKSEGGELGGPKGGRVGLLVTVFAAVGAAVALPAVGFVVGPLAVALTAAGAAGAAAGLISALGDWGVPDERIKAYEAAVKKGAILMMVAARSDEDARRLRAEWEKLGGSDIHYG
jgi:hypothetical protein